MWAPTAITPPADEACETRGWRRGLYRVRCGLFFKNLMSPGAVVWVWENLNPVEVPVPPPFNGMVIEADPSPFWVAVPGLLLLSLIFLIYSGISARNTEINYGE